MNDNTVNILTIDVEDWYHVCDVEEHVPMSTWSEREYRVRANLETILEYLVKYNAKATFFVLSYIAKRDPSILKLIKAAGCEIACHGHNHRMVLQSHPDEFREDIKYSKHLLEDMSGQEVCGYRSPEWSLRRETFWAFNILVEEGFKYDSSVFPSPFIISPRKTNADMYNSSDLRREDLDILHECKQPYKITCNAGYIKEFPVTTFPLGMLDVPFMGGLYLRALPKSLIIRWLERLNKQEKVGMLYIHPWEFDQNHPELNIPFMRKFGHFFRMKSVRGKFEAFLENFKFSSIKDLYTI